MRAGKLSLGCGSRRRLFCPGKGPAAGAGRVTLLPWSLKVPGAGAGGLAEVK